MRLTREQIKEKRIRELLRAIRACRNSHARQIYKEHLDFLRATL